MCTVQQTQAYVPLYIKPSFPCAQFSRLRLMSYYIMNIASNVQPAQQTQAYVPLYLKTSTLWPTA